MSKLLVVHSSPRFERSHSRAIANLFLEKWTALHPKTEVVTRDLALTPVPFITEGWIVGAYAPPEFQTEDSKAAIGVSDAFVDEFLAADSYLMSVPMNNLSIPAVFKAYIDQVVRVGRTFSVGPEGYKGLVTGKKMIIVTASGGSFRAGSPYAPYNFQEPYLRAVFGFIGFTDIEFVVTDNQNAGDELAVASKVEAAKKVESLAGTW